MRNKLVFIGLITAASLWFIFGNEEALKGLNFITFELFFIVLIVVNLLIISLLNLPKEEKVKIALDFNLLSCILIFISLFFSYIKQINYYISGQYLEIEYTLFIKLFLVFCLILVLVLSKVYLTFVKILEYEFSFLIVLSVIGMMVIVSAENLLLFYLALELMTLPLYILTAYRTEKIYSVEAGLKYFIVGSFSSALVLFGISFIYGSTGLLSFADLSLFFMALHEELNISLPVGNEIFCFYTGLLGIFLIFSGLFLKLGIVPFHLWVADVYEGAPLIITLFFSTIPKISIISVFIKFLFIFIIYLNILQYLLISLGVITIIIGVLGAVVQKKIKRLLAFSGITHMGYIFILFSLGNEFGLVSILLYLGVYIFSIFGFFAILIGLRDQTLNIDIKNILQLKGLGKSQPIVGITLSLLLFSFAGIPPMSGFFIKLLVISNLVGLNFMWISAVIMITTVCSTFYYIRLIALMFFYDSSENKKVLQSLKVESLAIAYGSLIICFIFFFLNGLSAQIATTAIESLFFFINII